MWISKDLIQIWTPLLQGISSVYSSFASELVSSMVKKLSSADDYVVNQRVIDPFASFETKDDPTKDPTYMLTLTCWLQYFVSELEDITVDCTLANLHKDDVLENCLKSPNTYTRSILQSLGQIDTEIAESIKPFMHYINQLLKNLDINKREKYDSLETITDEVLEKELDQMRVQLCEIGSNERTKCLYGTHKLLSDWEQETKKIEIVSRDTIRGSRLDLLSKTLFSEWNHKVLPPAWHHVYFPPRTRQDELADDGYERDFFPPKPFSQRMWAGASFDWNLDNPLVVNDQIEMKTKLDRVQLKEGRRGESAMVWLNKDIYNMSGWSMREQRCLVYHSEQTQETVGTNGIKMKRIPDFSMTFIPSSILLFRYSALTFNSHRIHYDHQYATEIEKHPAGRYC
ncbi:hypothetical protein G6F56_005779 [Rhizopus delemar]|nr:hypothetical protein G6F56_005779 [Rhizopus delemar]